MDEKIRGSLADALLDLFARLAETEPGSKEETAICDSIAKLYRTGIEEVKADTEYEDRCERREAEEKQRRLDDIFRKLQERKEWIYKLVRLGVDLFGIILPLLFTGKWFYDGLKFEETGIVASNFLRSVIQRFPKLFK